LNIKEARIRVGLTQKSFSDTFEIPIDVVKSWDSGRRTPPAWVEKLIIEKLERNEATMERNWYEYLEGQIENTKFYKLTQCAYIHGQINFAYVAGLISKEQRDELDARIPEY